MSGVEGSREWSKENLTERKRLKLVSLFLIPKENVNPPGTREYDPGTNASTLVFVVLLGL